MDDRPSRRSMSPDLDRDVVLTAAAGEPVIEQVEGLGASLAVTPTRAIIVRQGAHFRPRNGIREWPLSSLRDVHLAPPRNGNGRVVLRTGLYPWQAVNVFVSAQEWPAAERVVSQIRLRLAQAKRALAADAGSRDERSASDPPDRD
jgi:hypothetical protein